tara:strand:+ start:3492 stop:4112 length:621 start_codon:yes stop_codon:yes gene_type:complete
MSDELDKAGEFIDACIDNLDEARRLFAADPQVLYLTKIGSPILHWMVIEDFQIGVQRMLEEFKVDVDCLDDSGQTALHHACIVGRLGSARLLLKHGANIDVIHDTFDNPLQTAIHSEHLDVALLLVGHGAKLDYVLNGHFTVFHAMASMDEFSRSTMIAEIAAHGVTPESMFEKLQLDELYDSPAEAFGWQDEGSGDDPDDDLSEE